MSLALDPLEILSQVKITPRLIEDYQPLSESLEWRLSDRFWETTGTKGFVRSEVPYTITSSGTLSAQVARLVFANCLEHLSKGPIRLLEIGAGTGLFARLFLDEFERLCQAGGKDFFSRLTYFVTDASPRSVEQWKDLELFTGKPVEIGRANGLDPLKIMFDSGTTRLSGLRAVFSNYGLDAMPATVLRRGAHGPEELQIRTHLVSEPERINHGVRVDLQELRQLAEKTDLQLVPMLHLLEFEAAFRAPKHGYPHLEEALAFGHDWPRVILNHGAIRFLEGALEGLENHGFIFVTDYGISQASDAASLGATQRFGSTLAMGVNFPLLAHCFLNRGSAVSRPVQDERLPLHPLFIANREMPETDRAFHAAFDWDAHQSVNGLLEAARQHIDSGRFEQARQAYTDAIRARPRDWALMGEIAEFLIRHVADYQSGRKMATAALSLNPWYSVWLWNVLGDALFALQSYTEAHEIYLKAEKMEPNDVRTALNLGYSYWELGQPEAALQLLARGLAHDRGGLFRDRLLEKQQQILAGVAEGFRSEQEWLARRAARLSS